MQLTVVDDSNLDKAVNTERVIFIDFEQGILVLVKIIVPPFFNW